MNLSNSETAGRPIGGRACRAGAAFPRSIWRRHEGFECRSRPSNAPAAEARGSFGCRALLLALSLACFAPGASAATDLPAPAGHDYAPPEPGSYTLPAIKRAADGEVLDSHGRALRLGELTRGRITVMSFIYTRCAAAKACPYATGVLMQLHRLSAEDPALARNMRLISMSFDPEVDTPERMAAYSALAEGRKSAAEWRFVTTASQEKLKPILEAYGQAVDRKANPNDPTGPLNHTLRVFLIDREGRIRNIYSSGTLDPRLVLADIRTLLLKEK
jgi:cytochrome oxidase Cu insertion factor (SCO1/SenC/PrrC family)